MDIIGKEIRK